MNENFHIAIVYVNFESSYNRIAMFMYIKSIKDFTSIFILSSFVDKMTLFTEISIRLCMGK